MRIKSHANLYNIVGLLQSYTDHSVKLMPVSCPETGMSKVASK